MRKAYYFKDHKFKVYLIEAFFVSTFTCWTETYCVGVTDQIDIEQLYVIASNPKPDHVFTVLNYHYLINIVGLLIDGVQSGSTFTAPTVSLLNTSAYTTDLFLNM